MRNVHTVQHVEPHICFVVDFLITGLVRFGQKQSNSRNVYILHYPQMHKMPAHPLIMQLKEMFLQIQAYAANYF